MKKMTKIKTYSELNNLKTFRERFEYLKLDGVIGEETFGFDRYLNQKLYKSVEWKRVRDYVITRDCGCDLGIEGREIIDQQILIHHMNPIDRDDIINSSDYLFNPEYLICTTKNTHNAIHYGDEELLYNDPIIRTPDDTCPWKRRNNYGQN